MGNSYVSSLYHLVFGTKNHEPWLTPPIRERLWPYLGGVAAKNEMTALCVGGHNDHVHMLLSLPPDMAVSRAVQIIKGGSSLWVHQTFAELDGFAWQEGYGAFSIGIPQVADTRQYIQGQTEHHKKMPFREEYVAFLKKNGIPYDERYVWG